MANRALFLDADLGAGIYTTGIAYSLHFLGSMESLQDNLGILQFIPYWRPVHTVVFH